MKMRNLSDYDGNRNVLAIAGIIAVVLVVVIALVVASTAGGGSKNGNAGADTSATTSDGSGPQTTDDHSDEDGSGLNTDEGAPTTTIDPNQGADGEGLPEEDFGSNPIPASKFTTVWPPSESGLDDATRKTVGDLAAALVIADKTGTGRDKFPGYWPTVNDPSLPYVTGMVIDFSTAIATTSKLDDAKLVRTVTIWHGVGSGDVTFKQVQVSHYFKDDGKGGYTAVRTDDLPAAIQSSDGLLGGNSIIG